MTTTHSTARARNPILPATAFVPDGEPHVFEYHGEKRVFVYGSRDELVTGYCGYGHDAWSAPVDDLSEWTNHGEIFHVKQVWDIGFGKVPGQVFGAPDCVYHPGTEKYHLYTFLGTEYAMDGVQGPLPGSENFVPGFEDLGPKCVMAVSDSPAGPFSDPVMCDWPAANRAGAFDPSALVDQQEDGTVRVYAYWGMYNGDTKGDRWGELNPTDMRTLIDGTTRMPDRNAWHRTLNDADRNKGTILFEASSIKKVDKDRYVFVYSALEHYTALTYCYSSSPEGPWHYGGKIVDNGIHWKGGNNHGSIAYASGQWYVFYHRATCDDYNRQAMLEPIEMFLDGDKVVIPPVEMTSQGANTDGLDAYARFSANHASYLTQHATLMGRERNPDGMNPIAGIDTDGTVIGYKYLQFGEDAVMDVNEPNLSLNILLCRDTTMTVLVARSESVATQDAWVDIVSFQVQDHAVADGNYHEITVPITGLDQHATLKAIGGLKGKLALFFSFRGSSPECGMQHRGELCRFKAFSLHKAFEPHRRRSS